MASFTAGTTFTDGVANDVTAAKLGALVTNATPTSGLIQDRTTETVVGVNDTLLIGDSSDSNNLKKMTVANLLKAPLVSTSGTVDNLTTGTTTSTAQIVTSGTIATLNSTAATITTGTINSGTFGTTTSTASTITTGTINSGTFGTTTSTAATITTGTIPTLNSTTSTITNLAATTSTFLGTITGSTNVVNIGSGQIYKDATGKVLVNSATQKTTLLGTCKLQIYDSSLGLASNTDYGPQAILNSAGSTAGAASYFIFYRSRGSIESLTAAQNNDRIGNILFSGYDGTSWISNSLISSNIDGAVSTGTVPTNLQFSTGSSVGVTRMTIDSSGNVGIGKTPTNKLDIFAASNTGITISNGTMTGVFANSADTSIVVGSQTSHAVNFYTNNLPRMQIDASGNCLVVSAANLGYGAGSGGTVTQGTSKTTGVTLNKPTGQITMHNASLANGASVNFALTNSFISAVDILIVNPTAYSGYTVQCQNTSTGAANIRVTNISGGALAEPVTLQFAVIKGSAT